MFKIFKRFYWFIWKHKWWFILAQLATTIAIVLELITPYFFKLFVETLQRNDLNHLYTLILIFIGVLFGSLVFDNLKFFLGDIVSVDTAIDIRTTIFKYIQELDFSFHAGKSTGSLISAFKRGDNAFWGLYERLNQRMWQIFIGFFVMGYFFLKIDPRFILIFFISFLLTLVATKYLAGMNIRTREEFNEYEDKISGIITDNLINYETVKLFAKENWEIERLRSTFRDWKKFLWRHFYTYRYIDMSVGSLINLSIFIVLAFSLNLIKAGQIGIGDFILVVSYVNLFFPKLFDLIYGLREISTSYADIKKYFDLLDYEIDVKDPISPVSKDHVNGIIEFKDVSFTYGGRSKNAINGVDLEIKNGVFSNKDFYDQIVAVTKGAYYYYLRDRFIPENKEEETAQFFFIREYCFGSMFRFNSEGKFNIPYGGASYNDKSFHSKINNAFSYPVMNILKSTDIYNLDFREFFKKIDNRINKNDFCFFDPPYDSEFSEYDKQSFSKIDQKDLAVLFGKLKCRGLMIIKKTDFIFNIYKRQQETNPDINIDEYGKNYSYNVRGRNEREVTHLLILNYSPTKRKEIEKNIQLFSSEYL